MTPKRGKGGREKKERGRGRQRGRQAVRSPGRGRRRQLRQMRKRKAKFYVDVCLRNMKGKRASWRSDKSEAERGGRGEFAEFYRVCLCCVAIYQKYFMHISCAFMNLKLSFLANKLDVASLPPCILHTLRLCCFQRPSCCCCCWYFRRPQKAAANDKNLLPSHVSAARLDYASASLSSPSAALSLSPSLCLPAFVACKY